MNRRPAVAGRPHGGTGATSGRIVAVVAVIAVAVVAVTWWLSRPSDPPPPTASPSPSGTATPDPVQRTLLLQVRDDDQLAVDNVLIGSGGAPDRAAFLYQPGGLLVSVPGAGTLPLAEASQLSDTLASVQAVSDLLAVRVDGGFVMDRLAFAGLVDAVGGVSVQSRRDLVVTDDAGEPVVVIPAGARTLDGVAASYYVTVLMPDEPESARIARFSDVLVKVLAALPDDPDLLRQLLTGLGALARSTVPTEEVADFLLSVQGEILGERSVDETLRTVALVVDEETAYLPRQPDATAQVARLFPDAALTTADGAPPRVLVLDSGATPEGLDLVRDAVAETGMTYVWGGAAGGAPRPATVIEVADSAQAQEWGAQLVQVLGLTPSAVVVVPPNPAADVVIRVGSDVGAPAEPSSSAEPVAVVDPSGVAG
ncbi:MAG: LCP family protein [Candidatus Nanopelagicales bacterium]